MMEMVLWNLAPEDLKREYSYKGYSQACIPKIKVNITWLKLNFAWVIIGTKPFVMQNLSLVPFLFLEIWRHKISPLRKGTSHQIRIFTPENGFNFKKWVFCPESFFSTQKLTHLVNFSSFQKEIFFNFQIRRLNEQKIAAAPWLFNFAKILSERVSRIKIKSHKVWASWSQKGCQTGGAGQRAPLPSRLDKVKQGDSAAKPSKSIVSLNSIWIQIS